MKRLYKAEVNYEFVFVLDMEKEPDVDQFDEAYSYISQDIMYESVDLHSVNEIEHYDELPVGWPDCKPLGAEKVYNKLNAPDCAGFFENHTEAKRIADAMVKAGYDLDPSFVEDLQKVLNE